MTTRRKVCGIGFLALLTVLPPVAFSQEHADTSSGRPLHTTAPVTDVIADLEAYIPRRMEEDDVPGLSIAIVRDRQIVWKKGFGVTNTLSRRLVTPQTVFEVASNSKVVTAYLALRLVELGQLALDEPVRGQLHEPWLPSSVSGTCATCCPCWVSSSPLSHCPWW